jgi:acyl-CoA thioesterase
MIAAAAAAFENASQLRTVSLSVQFLRAARIGALMRIEPDIGQPDRKGVRHGIANCYADDELVARAQSVQGDPGEGVTRRWASPLSVPPPDQCPPREYRFGQEGLNAELDVRIASHAGTKRVGGPLADGRSLLWARLRRRDTGLTAPVLGLLSDHVAFAVGEAIEGRPIARTLDSSLRFVQAAPTTWVMLDVRVLASAGPFAHGVVDLWSESGALLATGAQSLLVMAEPS